MTDFQEYKSHQTVQARKVEEAEQVVTANGSMNAAGGDYVVRDDSGTVRVMTADEFESMWSSDGKPPKDDSESVTESETTATTTSRPVGKSNK